MTSALAIEIFQPDLEVFAGEERVILALARALVASGRPTSILCYRNPLDFASYAEFPLAVHALEPPPGTTAGARALGRHLAERHAAGAPLPMLCNIQSAYHAGFGVRTPYHLRIPDTFRLLKADTATGIRAWARRRVVQSMTGRGIRRAASFSTNTHHLSAEMRTLYGRAAEILYLGGIASSDPPASKQVDGPVRLLSVSRIEASKRIDWIVEGLHALDAAGSLPPWQLDIVGTGPARGSLEELVARLGLAQRVRFLGFVSDAVLEQTYADAHIFAMPARQGYGIPAIEAINHRLGLVLTSESGVFEILADTPWAIVAEPDSIAFRNALGEMIRRVSMGGLLASPLPRLPTEADWARQIIALSGW